MLAPRGTPIRNSYGTCDRSRRGPQIFRVGLMGGVPKVLKVLYLSRGVLTMDSTRNQIVTNQIVRAYLNTGHVFLKTRSEQDSFAFDMHSTLLYDERSLQTMPLLKQSANHRFTQDGLLILAPCLVSCLPV